VAASLACLALSLAAAVAVGVTRPSPAVAAGEKKAAESLQKLVPAGEPPATLDSPLLPPEAVPPKPDGALLAVSRLPSGERGRAGVLPPRPPRPPYRPKKTLILVIDDAGYNMKELEAFLRLPLPLTIAVLPGLPNSEAAARAVRAAGKELILHQPMAALGGQDPGPGAILAVDSPSRAGRLVEENLKSVPGAVGMNNHMGSAVTTEPPIMEAVAAIAKRRGIYYLDSLTVPGTATHEAALREGIRYWERDVFLDNAPDRASIIRAVEDGKKRADTGRPAIMIGHVWSAELAQAIMELYPHLVEEGYSLSTITRYMLAEAEGDEDPRD
jgi:polysaccharide deacetylase 2 family uncharacterized protein YibQ